jgi:acyl carrier protein
MTTATDIERWIVDAMADVAPDASFDGVDADEPLAEQLDLDSMDSMRFLERLGDLAGIRIPDRDASHLHTLGQIRAYLAKSTTG